MNSINKLKLKNYIKLCLSEGIDHEDILNIAIKSAADPRDVPLVETLHQNIAHMTIALKEVETRAIRVINKMNRLGIEEVDQCVLPLINSVTTLKEMIAETEGYLNHYSSNKCLVSYDD